MRSVEIFKFQQRFDYCRAVWVIFKIALFPGSHTLIVFLLCLHLQAVKAEARNEAKLLK